MLETQNIKVKIGEEPPCMSQITDSIWTFRADLKLCGLDLGCCMTVIKLSDGNLLIHSPIEYSKQIGTVLETLGCVKYIIAPNSYHHLFISSYLDKYDANLYTVEDVAKKRPELPRLNVVIEGDNVLWAGDFEWTIINGRRVQEMVLLHKASQTLILTDLAFNIPEPIQPLRLAWHRALRACGKFIPSRICVLIFGRSAAVKAKIQKICGWDFKRIVVSHGSPVTENANEVFRRAMQLFNV